MDKYETQKWAKILNHPRSTAEQKTEARRRLGVPEEPEQRTLTTPYIADLDPAVESYWGVRKMEYEERDPLAEQIYSDLVRILVLGDCPLECVRRLVHVIAACRSEWMRDHVGTALRSSYKYHCDELGPKLATEVREALEAAQLLIEEPAS
jgi:hypothetical protein